MPTVIQNGCTYRIVKTYHCGCEYEYAPPTPKEGYIDLLLVGGGGGTVKETNCAWWSSQMGGGGGGGGVKECLQFLLNGDTYNVTIGAGGITGGRNVDKRGGTTCFGDYEVSGGGGASGVQEYANSIDGGGAGQGCRTDNYCTYKGTGKYDGGSKGGATGGGGGAGGAGCAGSSDGTRGGDGGIGVESCISGEACYYGGGGGGANPYGTQYCCGLGGCGGGGNGGKCPGYGSNASYYGGGGGGGGGTGCQGIVILRYKTDGSNGILPTSTGGIKYTCGDYTIHCFTSNDVFTPVYK